MTRLLHLLWTLVIFVDSISLYKFPSHFIYQLTKNVRYWPYSGSKYFITGFCSARKLSIQSILWACDNFLCAVITTFLYCRWPNISYKNLVIPLNIKYEKTSFALGDCYFIIRLLFSKNGMKVSLSPQIAWKFYIIDFNHSGE